MFYVFQIDMQIGNVYHADIINQSVFILINNRLINVCLVSVNQLLFFRLFADLLSFSGALGIEIIVNSLQEKVVTNTHMNK